MGFFEFVQNNFLHVLPLIVATLFAVAIIAERTRALFKAYPMKNTQGFLDKITELTLSGHTSEAVALCDQFKKKPLAHIVKSALIRAHLPEGMIEHGIQYALGEVTQQIQKRTAFLATIANVATLLGLFGTILGLIHSFEAVGHADAQQKSQLLASGIATAMNATMFGLGIAIPCMVAFSFLMNRSNRLTGEFENAAVRVMEILKQRYYSAESLKAYNDQWQNAQTSKNGKVVPFGKAA